MNSSINIKVTSSPLVSVIVITYNNSKFVAETLESARSQTYQNIELIITDDCSTDDTIEICQNWIGKNKNRFTSTEIIISDKNTGIPANCNRGVHVARGEWIKIIAGDDLFKMDAVESVIKYVNQNPHIRALDSNVSILNSNLSEPEEFLNKKRMLFFDNKADASYQLKLLANNLFGQRIISTLGVFLKRDLIIESGGFDEKYKLLEDTPMWCRILKSGEKFYLFDHYTVKYRIHKDSVSFNDKTKSDCVLSGFEITLNEFVWNYFFPYLTKINKLNTIWLTFMNRLILRAGNKGVVAEYLLKMATFFQPVRLLWFQRKFGKDSLTS